jgi:hypothetical protein
VREKEGRRREGRKEIKEERGRKERTYTEETEDDEQERPLHLSNVLAGRQSCNGLTHADREELEEEDEGD